MEDKTKFLAEHRQAYINHERQIELARNGALVMDNRAARRRQAAINRKLDKRDKRRVKAT